MDINELLKIGAAEFSKSEMSGSAGSGLDLDALTSALSGLAGGEGGIDIAGLLGKMQSSGLADVAQSWLGDGSNAEISADQVTDLIGADKISVFAAQLGLNKEEAIGGLRDAMPQMVDKASPGGSLLDSIGGVEGALNLASKLFSR